MLLKDLRDSLLRNIGGGKTTTADPLDPQYINKMINTFRAEIIQRNYKKNSTINPICYQRFNLIYEPLLQPANPGYVLFRLPPTIQMGDEDGIRYIGSISCSRAWKRIFNRGELSTYNSHRFTALNKGRNKNRIFVLYDGTQQLLEVYNDLELQEGMVEGIFANPFDVPSWNPDLDNYPINEDDIAEMESLIYKNRTVITKGTKPEYDFNIPSGNIAEPPRQEKLP